MQEIYDHHFIRTLISKHDYCKNTEQHFVLYQEHDDDISAMANDENKIDHIKKAVCKELEIGNFHLNKSKTEEYIIKQNGNESWKE